MSASTLQQALDVERQSVGAMLDPLILSSERWASPVHRPMSDEQIALTPLAFNPGHAAVR